MTAAPAWRRLNKNSFLCAWEPNATRASELFTAWSRAWLGQATELRFLKNRPKTRALVKPMPRRDTEAGSGSLAIGVTAIEEPV
jgi:hypothetical protein